MSHKFNKNFGNWKTICQNFFQIYSNNLEEKDEEEKDLINIEHSEQKANPEMVKMLLTLDDQM